MKNWILFALGLSAILAHADSPPPASTDRLREGTTNLYFTTARARGSVSASSPLLFSGGTFSIPPASSSANGYLTSTHWSLFNSKEPALAAGLTSQYYRGDKSWATLDTSVVPENGSLYFTSGRFDTAFSGKTTTDLAEGSNAYYTSARFNSSFSGKTTTDLTEGSNLYWTSGRFDTALSGKSTSNLTEGTNLYFTNARVDTEFDTRLATKSTSNLTEGSNLYFTNARVDTEFDTRLATKSTTNLSEGSNLYYTTGRFDTALATKTTANLTEGSNLYYTDARVTTLAKNGMTAQQLYVSKDTGSDSTGDGSLLKPYRTIGAAMTAANSIAAFFKQVVINVSPSNGGTGSGYVENVTFSQQGIHLLCNSNRSNSRGCLISGTVTVNMTGTNGGTNYVAASNESYMSGFVVVINSASAAPFNFTGTVYQKFIINNCYFDQNGSSNNSVVSNTGVTGSTPSTVISYDSTFNNSNATNPALLFSAGRFWMYGTTGTIQNGNAAGPSVTQTGTTSFIANIVQIAGQYNLSDNTATATFNLTTIASGANPCIVTPASPNTGYALLAYFGCNSTATNSITGSGVVVNTPGNIRLSSSGDIVSTVTQTSFPGLPQGSVLIGNKAPSATNVLLSVFDGHIKASQTTAATATVNANAGTSATCTLTNGRDHSGVINLTTGSASWASGTQCTLTFNKAFATAPNCVLSSRNALAASKLVSQQIFNTTTTTTLVLGFGAADTAASAMQFWYSCWEP